MGQEQVLPIIIPDPEEPQAGEVPHLDDLNNNVNQPDEDHDDDDDDSIDVQLSFTDASMQETGQENSSMTSIESATNNIAGPSDPVGTNGTGIQMMDTEKMEDVNDFTEGSDWENLPNVVMSVLFSQLTDKDKISAGLTCRRWRKALDDPTLWRKHKINFTNSCVSRNYTQRVLSYARQYGQHMYKLSIQCYHPNNSMTKKFQSCITSYLHVLNTRRGDNRRCQLRELTINKLHMERYWRSETIRNRLTNSFCRFLQKQFKLRMCDFSTTTLPVQDGLRVLGALGESSGRRVRHLNMEDFFAARLAIYAMPRYRLVMSAFHNLQVLVTNYNYMSEEVMNLLADNCKHKLKNLSLKVYRTDPIQHQIQPCTWRHLCRECPQLNVCLYFEAVGSYTDITRIACREIPLRVLQIWTGMTHQEEYFGLTDTIAYITRTFSKTLVDVCLYLENDDEEIDEAILAFLAQSRHLVNFDLHSTLMIPTVHTICEWQEQYKIGLQRFHLVVDNLTTAEEELLDHVTDKYSGMVDERGLDFHLFANPILLD